MDRSGELNEWYREYGATAQTASTEALLMGDENAAVEVLRRSNVERSEFHAESAGKSAITMFKGSPNILGEVEEESIDALREKYRCCPPS